MLLQCTDNQVTYYDLSMILCLDSVSVIYSNYWISDCRINYGTAQLQGKTRVARSRVLLTSFLRVASRVACLLADNC